MKHFAIIAALMLAFTASAQDKPKEDWREKMMSEKVAFLTIETGITPEEAQVFWPVYNQISKEMDAALHNIRKAFQDLEKAVSEGRPDSEIENLLKAYQEAVSAKNNLENSQAEKYAKVLPTDKLAKLYIGEEKFRRHHIRRMHHKPEPKKD